MLHYSASVWLAELVTDHLSGVKHAFCTGVRANFSAGECALSTTINVFTHARAPLSSTLWLSNTAMPTVDQSRAAARLLTGLVNFCYFKCALNKLTWLDMTWLQDRDWGKRWSREGDEKKTAWRLADVWQQVTDRDGGGEGRVKAGMVNDALMTSKVSNAWFSDRFRQVLNTTSLHSR